MRAPAGRRRIQHQHHAHGGVASRARSRGGAREPGCASSAFAYGSDPRGVGAGDPWGLDAHERLGQPPPAGVRRKRSEASPGPPRPRLPRRRVVASERLESGAGPAHSAEGARAVRPDGRELQPADYGLVPGGREMVAVGAVVDGTVRVVVGQEPPRPSEVVPVVHRPGGMRRPASRGQPGGAADLATGIRGSAQQPHGDDRREQGRPAREEQPAGHAGDHRGVLPLDVRQPRRGRQSAR